VIAGRIFYRAKFRPYTNARASSFGTRPDLTALNPTSALPPESGPKSDIAPCPVWRDKQMARICGPLPLEPAQDQIWRGYSRDGHFRVRQARVALRRDRARERGGRAAAWSTIHADNPSSFAFRHGQRFQPGFRFPGVIVGSPNDRFAPEAAVHPGPYFPRSDNKRQKRPTRALHRMAFARPSPLGPSKDFRLGAHSVRVGVPVQGVMELPTVQAKIHASTNPSASNSVFSNLQGGRLDRLAGWLGPRNSNRLFCERIYPAAGLQ